MIKDNKIQRFVVRLPKELHEIIREEAYYKRISMNSIIVNALRKKRRRIKKKNIKPSFN